MLAVIIGGPITGTSCCETTTANMLYENSRAVKEVLSFKPKLHSTCSIGNESAPIHLTQCRFPGLAVSDVKIKFKKMKVVYLTWQQCMLDSHNYNKIQIRQHSKTVTVWNYQNAHCSLIKNYCVIYYNCRHTFVPCLLWICSRFIQQAVYNKSTNNRTCGIWAFYDKRFFFHQATLFTPCRLIDSFLGPLWWGIVLYAY